MKQNNIEGGIKAMNDKHDHGQEAEAQKLWEKSEQLKFIKDLKAGGKSMTEIMEQFDYQTAFAKSPLELGCSDGRIREHRFGGAGNFILANDVEQEKFVSENKGKFDEVKSHDGCGAAGIKFKQILEAGLPLPANVITADDLGKYFSKQLAEKLGAEYGHTGKDEMSGPVHNERAIYFDGTGKFNPSALSELPAGFICSGQTLGLSQEYCEKEIATLAKIAFSDHGFGRRFNKDNPLYIVVSANNQGQLDQLLKIAEKTAEEFQGKMVVDGFIAE